MILSYIATDFRERFASSLPPSVGGLASDVALFGQWCADAHQAIWDGNTTGYFGPDPMEDVAAIASQGVVLNDLLEQQGFTPPDPRKTYATDPMGMLATLAEFYCKVAPLVSDPSHTVH